MKILHIFRNRPDDTIIELIDALTIEGDESAFEPLFRNDVDWEHLVDKIFSHEKIICWW